MKFLQRSLAVFALAGLLATASAQTPSSPKPAGAPPKPAGATTRRRPAAKKPAGANARLDGIAAIVNDDVILVSEVEEQLAILVNQAMQNGSPEPDSSQLDTLRRQILDQYITEKLVYQEGKRLGLTVPEAEIQKQVDQAIGDLKERLGGDEGFQQQLKKENMTEARLREKYHADAERGLLAQKARDKAIPRKSVPAAEAEAFFKDHPDQFPKRPGEVKLTVIQIPITPDSVADARGRARITEIRNRITAGARFAKVAADSSEDPGSARSGGDLGYFTRGTMDPKFEDAAFALKPGQMSDPVHSSFGWHLIEAIDRDTVKNKAGLDSVDAKGVPVLEMHARHILIRVPTNEADLARAKLLAEKVRAEAMKGTNFVTLVHRYSKYQGTQDADGDIGFVALASLAPNIRAGVDSLAVNDVSPVLQNQIGFNIFKLTDRKPERPYKLEEIREQLPTAVEEIRFRQRFDEWVKGLRKKAHLEIRYP